MTSTTRPAPGRFVTPLVVAAVVGLTGGCDIPTSAPEWDTLWALPLDDVRMSVETLLPTSVSVDGTGEHFLVELSQASQTRTLGALCSVCLLFEGAEVPKPAFEGSFQLVEPLPSEVEGGALVGGVIRLRFLNGFAFDALRPSETARGAILLELRDGSPQGRLLAMDTIRGEESALPAGGVLVRTVTPTPGPISSGVWVRAVLTSPAGDPVLIQNDETLTMEVETEVLRVSSARLRVAGRGVELDSQPLDLADVDGQVVDRIRDGVLRLAIRSDFTFAVQMELRIEGPQTPAITRILPIGPGSSEVALSFTGNELRTVFGAPEVLLTGQGTVPQGTPPETVTPTQAVILHTRFDLTLRMGGS